MNRQFIYIICTAIFCINLFSGSANAIKIGLSTDLNEIWTGTSVKGVITDANTDKPICVLDPMVSYKLKSGKNSIEITIKSHKYSLGSNSVRIKPYTEGFVSTKNKWYRGSLIVNNYGGGLTVINDIKLEDYLLGVVPSEMPSSWPEEALKAQAIAARSYAVANLGKNGSKGYDLKDNTYDQAYGGASAETKNTNRAVAETKGIVATYNRKVISAYYCSSAGGQTKESSEVWTKDLPYIRSVDSFDKDTKKRGHGIGMSQYGANNMAKQGYNAYQILTYFYNNIKFGKLDPSWEL